MDEDQLQKENRRLKEENRSLKKLIKKLSKGNKRLEDLEEIIKETSYKEQEETAQRCNKCKKGTLKETELGTVRKIIQCTNCSHRMVIKIGQESKT